MTNHAIDPSQHKAAKVVGIAYLLAMATSIFAEEFVRAKLIDYDNAIATAQNIMANKMLFRVGILAELITYATDLALITALYVILSPVNRHLALFAAFLRIVAETVCVSMAAHSFDVLRILSGAEYLQVFESEQLAALARLSLGAHGTFYNVGFVILGLGSTVFGWLWYKSNYVPKAWGVLGVVASFLLSAGTVVILLVPDLQMVLYPWYMVPMFFLEVGLGIWLLVKGLRTT